MIVDRYEVSPVQEAILAACRSGADAALYHSQSVFRVSTQLDPERLGRAWRRIVEMYDVCRTSFSWDDAERPVQLLHDSDLDAPVRVLDFRDAATDKLDVVVDRYLAEDGAEGFDLNAPPLVRLGLLRLPSDVHYLVWSTHHSVLDGWSSQLLFSRLLDLYSSDNEPDELPAFRFRDYVDWIRTRDGAAAEAFWRSTLSGSSTTDLGLTTTADASDRGVAQASTRVNVDPVSEPTTTKLRELARHHHTTLTTIVHAAWGILMSRYSGSADVLFGTVVSGRGADLDGMLDAVGNFINVLPVRAIVSGANRLDDLVDDLQDQLSEAQEFEYVPLRTIQSWSESDPRRRLFDVVLSVAIEQGTVAKSDGLRCETVRSVGPSSFPLTVGVAPGRRIALSALYDESYVDSESANGLLSHYRRLLESIAEDPTSVIDELQMLSDDEIRRQVMELDGTTREHQDVQVLHELVERQARQTPEAVAVLDGDRQITYRELDERAERLSARLRARGVGPDSIVGVCLGRSTDLVVALLGVLKAGGAYLPLDPEYPVDRLHFTVDDSGVEIVVSLRCLADRIPGFIGTVVCLDEPEPAPKPAEENATANHPTAANLAYVIYTSGSTGTPKGSMLTHGAICNVIVEQRGLLGLGVDDRVLQSMSFGFDVSTLEIFLALGSGATLVLAPPDGLAGDSLTAFLEKNQVTVAAIPPSVLEATEARPLPSMRTILTGGEQCPAPVAERWRGAGIRLWNMYGLTETTIGSSLEEFHPDSGKPCLGRPIGNTRLLVLGTDLKPTPIGVPGELYVGGAGLQRGYVARPDRTAERMVPSPSGPPGARIYRTGDRVRYHRNGRLEYLGRVDQQVKVRGQRIEPAEVEAHLTSHPHVREAVAKVEDSELWAYVLLRAGAAPGDVEEYLRQRLPSFMVPRSIVPIEEWPRLPNGKIDRARLTAKTRVPTSSPDQTAVTLPRNDAERAIAAAIAEVLGVDEVDVHSNFFELGGDSILAIQVVSRANQSGLGLSTRQLFRHPTVAELASLATTAENSRAESGHDGEAEDEIPLTPNQQWFFGLDLPQPEQAYEWARFPVPVSISIDDLERVVNALVERHVALRLRFRRSDTGWHQTVTTAAPTVRIRRTSVAGFDERQLARARSREVRALGRGLDLSSGTLVACGLLEGEEIGAELVMVAHRLVIDDASWHVLAGDLERAYGQLAAGSQLELGVPPTSFAEWARSDSATVPVVDRIPRDHESGPNSTGSEAELSAGLTVETSELLRTGGSAVLLAALAEVLDRWTSGAGLVIATPMGEGKRPVYDPDLSQTVGWLDESRHAYRTGDASPRMAEVSCCFLDNEPADLNPDTRLSRAAGTMGSGPESPRPYVFEIVARVVEGATHIRWTYSSNLHRKDQVQALLQGLVEAVERRAPEERGVQ